MASIDFRTDFQRHQGFHGGFIREKYGELFPSRTEDLPVRTGRLNSWCDPFQNLFTDRFSMDIGILRQLVDADDCDEKIFSRVVRSLRHRPDDRVCR